jgi:hypothetical protein
MLVASRKIADARFQGIGAGNVICPVVAMRELLPIYAVIRQSLRMVAGA